MCVLVSLGRTQRRNQTFGGLQSLFRAMVCSENLKHENSKCYAQPAVSHCAATPSETALQRMSVDVHWVLLPPWRASGIEKSTGEAESDFFDTRVFIFDYPIFRSSLLPVVIPKKTHASTNSHIASLDVFPPPHQEIKTPPPPREPQKNCFGRAFSTTSRRSQLSTGH